MADNEQRELKALRKKVQTLEDALLEFNIEQPPFEPYTPFTMQVSPSSSVGSAHPESPPVSNEMPAPKSPALDWPKNSMH